MGTDSTCMLYETLSKDEKHLVEGCIKPKERLVCNILVSVNVSSPSKD